MSKKPVMRKYQRSKIIKPNVTVSSSLSEMFNRFMLFKKTEGLAKATLSDYYLHFKYLMDYLEEDVPASQCDVDLFRGYIGYMLHEKSFSPMTLNVRIRTIRAFLRYCYQEGWIEEAIHERFKPIKTQEDTLESFTPEEIKRLLQAVDDDTYRGFRDKVMIYVLLDTMVRCSELINIKRDLVDIKEGFIQLESHETKTKRARIVPLSSKTIRLLKEYMNLSADFHSEYLFVTYDGKPLCDSTVRYNLGNGEMRRVSAPTNGYLHIRSGIQALCFTF